jgi:predicted nucleic acid-binding protein
MGRLTLPSAGPIYVDANSVIYRVESLEPYSSASSPLWEALQAGSCQVVSSELTLLEVLVKPLRDGNLALAAVYRRILLATNGLVCLAIDQEILELAGRIRADHRLKTPDAIHAATAIRSGATLFLTNDADFRGVPGLNVALLGEIAAS